MWRAFVSRSCTALFELIKKFVQFLVKKLNLLAHCLQLLRLQRHLTTHDLQRVFLKCKAGLQVGNLFRGRHFAVLRIICHYVY